LIGFISVLFSYKADEYIASSFSLGAKL